MLETRRAVSALETGGGFSPRRALVAPCWKHWRYHVALRRRAPLVGSAEGESFETGGFEDDLVSDARVARRPLGFGFPLG